MEDFRASLRKLRPNGYGHGSATKGRRGFKRFKPIQQFRAVSSSFPRSLSGAAVATTPRPERDRGKPRRYLFFE
eukprot:1281443-Alexandrium_andersonii.AAC.1